MPVNAHTDPLFFTSLSLTDQYLVKDFPPPQRLRLHSRSGCGVCSVACQDFIIIPLKNNSRGALEPPSAPAGLFVLLGLTALVLPSGGGQGREGGSNSAY